MKFKYLSVLFVLVFCRSQIMNAQLEKSMWLLAKPGDLEEMISKAGFKIIKAYDSLPAQFSNRLICTTWFGFEGAESLTEPYDSKVTAKIGKKGITFYEHSMLNNEFIIKTFSCVKDSVTYTLYVGFTTLVYAVPEISEGNEMIVYAGIVLDKKLSANSKFKVSLITSNFFEEPGDKNLVEFPMPFGYTKNAAREKLSDPSASGHLNAENVDWDRWDDLGLLIYYNSSSAIQELEMTSFGNGADCKKFNGTVFGLRLYSSIMDAIHMLGEPYAYPEKEYEWEKPTAVWKKLNWWITVSYSEETAPGYCNTTTLMPGMITQIAAREVVATSDIKDYYYPTYYKECNEFIYKKDYPGLENFLKSKPNIRVPDDNEYVTDNPLLLAIQEQQFDMVKLLLEYGTDPNYSEDGPRFDGWAAPYDYILIVPDYPLTIPCIELLCKYGVDINRAIAAGLKYKNFDYLNAVKRAHPDFSKTDLTPHLAFVLYRNELPGIQWLIENGANPNQKYEYSEEGKTFLEMGLDSKDGKIKSYFKQLNKKP